VGARVHLGAHVLRPKFVELGVVVLLSSCHLTCCRRMAVTGAEPEASRQRGTKHSAHDNQSSKKVDETYDKGMSTVNGLVVSC
jgi:hypothetical protein